MQDRQRRRRLVQAGNVNYADEADLPSAVPVFPLSGALLLPGGQLPLNIFEPRYLAMIDDAMASDRIIGMIQPRLDGASRSDGDPELCQVGCLGRITSLTETGDGRYIINLQGIARFRVTEEIHRQNKPYRCCRLTAFLRDLNFGEGAKEVDRDALLKAFRQYLDANQLEADWESVSRASNETLVNALCMMSPYGAAEKQALLEAPDLKTRAETLIAITEIALAREGEDGSNHTLQ
ncbi:LON peptidase substrate-binding domain-containing protein [Aurantimonas sp. VKM B-3413]|uniref:LON peptidase substrate-binding domain-containing protein n=1 Tax=Aurantimonas sp. VKM B-3413 TaxID=2779401 RepID=UPI001E352F43|nr:LON peptidase substrate-binding domain-containing protein [Aurantimonas sp. VKM B-3413]MCB8839239.1 LON peptidase substrate-binding domain-containing protein [Aurantimonas sp. VKM B-3413]